MPDHEHDTQKEEKTNQPAERPKDQGRREFLKKGAKAVGGAILAGISISAVAQGPTRSSTPSAESRGLAIGSSRGETDLEVKNTEFNRLMTEVAEKLGWRVKTAPSWIDRGGRCLSFNRSIDWEGCLASFNGFQGPLRQETFKPSGYLVYAWGEYTSDDDSGQRLLVFPKEIEALPFNSGDYADGSLFRTFEQQKEAAGKFNFVFPESLNERLQQGTTVPIGYWALSKEEMDKLGNIFIKLP